MSDLTERYRLAQMHKAIEARGGKKIKLRWNTPTEVRRSLAKVNNMVANHELLPKEANAIFFSANLILKALELERDEKAAVKEKEAPGGMHKEDIRDNDAK